MSEVLVKIKVDSKDAKKSVEQFSKSTEKLSKDSAKVSKSFGSGFSKNLKGASEGVSELGGAFGILGGGMGQATGGVKQLGSAFKKLLANPIVLVLSAIVLVLASLYKAFTSTKEGGEQMDAIFKALGSIMDVIRDRILKVIGAFKSLFSGDFKKAAEQFKEAHAGIGDEIAREAQETYKLTRALQKLKDQQRDLATETARQNKNLAEARLLAQDENATIEERLQALDKVSKAEDELLNKRLEHARKTLEAETRLAEMSDSDAETLDKLATLQQNLYNLETESFNKKKAVQRESLRLLREQEAEEKRIAQERSQRYKERLKEEQDANLKTLEFEKQKALIYADSELEKFMIEQNHFDKLLKLYENDEKKYLELQRAKLLASEQFNKDVADEIQKATIKRINEAKKTEVEITNVQKVGQEEQKVNALDHLETLIRTQQDKIQKFNEYGQMANEVFGQVAGFISDAINKNLEEQSALIDSQTEKQNKILDNRLKRGVISERQAEIEKEKIQKQAEAKKEKLQRDAFEKKKKLDITQAIINTALSVSSALSAGFPLGLIMAGVYGALGGVQISTIKNQKFAKGGLLKGASHSQGGIPTPFGELEGGEAVINKKSTAMFKNQLSAINEAGGGVKFARGGILGERQSETASEVVNQAQAQQQTIKAYVVTNEITSAQAKGEAIENRASF